jgi:hypothetical protein
MSGRDWLVCVVPEAVVGQAHSIKSVAATSSVRGTVRPSAFVVLRLKTNSNFVGCIMGSGVAGPGMTEGDNGYCGGLKLW